jgi:uncharacterized protein (TIGR03032 family)
MPAHQDSVKSNESKKIDYSCEYSEGLPRLLKELNISIAFTSYQAGRLMFVRSDGETIDVNFKAFPRPMGLTFTGNELTLGTFTQLINFRREDSLVAKLKRPLQFIDDDITAPTLKKKNKPAPNQFESTARDASKEAAQAPVGSAHLSGESGDDSALDSDSHDNGSDDEKARLAKRRALIKQREAELHAPVDSRVDSCFITRSSHFTGMINIHDVEWGDGDLWAVNSSFSCLCTFDPDYSFVPRWKPHFISELVPEDRCHLNGMALRDGQPAFVTTFSTFDEPGMWRKGEKFNGTLMRVADNKILIDGLAMPHSPRWYRDHVYFCNSGYGEVKRYSEKTEQVDTVAELPGFTRGMDFYGSLLLVGLSKVRQSDVTSPAPLAKKYEDTFSGLAFINLDSGELIGTLSFVGNVEQIYDVAILHDTTFPEFIEPGHPRLRNHFVHPGLTQ